MVDAPVSGECNHAAARQVVGHGGGRTETFERLKPYCCRYFGPKVTHVGANGVALSMKIAVNLQLSRVQMMAFSEAILLAEKSGSCARSRGRCDGAQRDSFSHDPVPRPLRPQTARRGAGST